MDNLELLGPTFKGRTASVSFRLDVIGITRAMAEREWGADAAVAEGGAPPLGGVGWGPQPSMTEQDEEEEEDDDDDSDEESGEEGSSSEEEEEEETPGGMRSVSMSSLNVYPWRSTAAQPTNALARRMLEERGYTPPALPPPGLSSEPNQITFERNSSAPSISSSQRPPTTPALGGRLREAAERTMPPRGKSSQQFGFGSSVPRRITSSSILRSTSPINRKLAASNTSSAASLLPPPPPDQPPVRPPTSAESWLRPHSAPSARLLMQLDECARIKAAFANAGIPCPTAAIERGLLIPEDRPTVMCMAALPMPPGYGMELPKHLLPKGKKGKGKKKGGKKKGGGKSPRKKK